MRIIIIGGGPSGIVCAINAKNKNNEVIVLEKNEKPLKKLLLTGNGRCNYLNDNYSIDNYYSRDKEYIKDIININNINTVNDFFNSIGVISKNKNGYIYPVTNQAKTIYDSLYRKALNKDINFKYNCNVLDIRKDNNSFIVKTSNKEYICDKLVIATGGLSYPKTGSTGDGYKLLEKLGHTIIKPLPALVQLISNNSYLREWDGVRLDVILTLEEDGKVIRIEKGEVQLTDYGISGICTFNLSNYISRGLDVAKKEIVYINFVPFIGKNINNWLDKYNEINNYKSIKELLEGFIPTKVVGVILKTSNINENIKYDDLSINEKEILINNLISFKLNITGTKGFDNSQITNGGIPLNEVNINTFESKIVNNLYIIGELLDINGDCGGYNLTVCWISGLLAGRSINDKN